MNRSIEAILLLERLLARESGHFDAMFVLASAFYTNSEYQATLAMYEHIIMSTKDARKVLDAKINKKIVLDALYVQ